jgi:hypothetical protein
MKANGRREKKKRVVEGRIRMPPFGVPPSGGFGASSRLPRKRGTPNGRARLLWAVSGCASVKKTPEIVLGRPAAICQIILDQKTPL